jgi:hypothetical protein
MRISSSKLLKITRSLKDLHPMWCFVPFVVLINDASSECYSSSKLINAEGFGCTGQVGAKVPKGTAEVAQVGVS